jgi:UPF0042 nucleotide-binding protein
MNNSATGQHLIIVSGLSGAGKSTALKALEDMGYHCIDNLPTPLLGAFARQLQAEPDAYRRVALGMDVRAPGLDTQALSSWIETLRASGIRAKVLFLEADDSALLKRYGATRRPHPLAQGEDALLSAIGRERQLLAPLRDLADWRIDTTQTNIHQLKHQTWRHVGPETDDMTVVVQSFGFSHGVPPDADYVFDARCLPNPHWDDALRPLTGRDAPVAEYLGRDPDVKRLGDDVEAFLRTWLPAHENTRRSFITVAIGCTGGRHRSVYLAEQLSRALRDEFPELVLHHRELAE